MPRPTSAVLATVLALLLFSPGVSFGQSELVIVKKGEKVFHRAGCDAIKNAKDVLALSLAQAKARGLTQHEGCDPEKMPPDSSGKSAPTYVYVDGSRYYHKKDCKNLGKDAKRVELEEAGKKLWPCPVCKPPIRKRKGTG